jgi:outer membrane protein assembly factor BamB
MTRLFGLVLVLTLSTRLLAADPIMFRGGPAHLGVYESAAPTLSVVKWKFKTQGRIVSTPVVSGDLVFVGSADHRLYAVRVADGTLAWAFKSDQAVNSSPAVGNGFVYFNSLDGYFYALNAATGALAWKFQTGGERRFTAPGIHGIVPASELMPDPFDVFLSSPVLTGGLVAFGSGDHHVYALDAATGSLRWKFMTGDVVHATPAVADGVLYVGSWDRNLYALDNQTGSVRWKFQTGDDQKVHNQIGIASSAAVVNSVVLFGCRDGHFYALDARTGQLKWREDNEMGWVIASPAVRDGIVYFPTSDGTQFKAIAIATGALNWRTVDKAISFSSPAIAGDAIYFGSHDGWLRSLDLATGRLRAEFQTDGSKENASKYIAADGTINMKSIYSDTTLDGVILGLDRMYSLGSVLSSPVIAGGIVYFGSTDGNLYAVG